MKRKTAILLVLAILTSLLIITLTYQDLINNEVSFIRVLMDTMIISSWIFFLYLYAKEK